jgi:hypothetical protein
MVLPGKLHKLVKGSHIVYGEIGQDFAVYHYSGFGQTLDQAIVGQTGGTTGGIDTSDPQPTEIAFARPAVAIGVIQTAHAVLERHTIKFATCAAITFDRL